MHIARIATIAVLAGAALAAPTAAHATTPALPAPSTAIATATASVAAAPTVLHVEFPTAVAPQVGVDGTLPFLDWPAAQNPHGFEGSGFRIYLDREYTGPGTYTMTLQKIGPGVSAEYPDGTIVVDANGLKRHPSNGNDTQVVTTLPALAPEPVEVPRAEDRAGVEPGAQQPTDEVPAVTAPSALAEAPAAAGTVVPAPTGEALPPSDTVRTAGTNTVPLAQTGYGEGVPVRGPVLVLVAAVLVTVATVWARRAHA